MELVLQRKVSKPALAHATLGLLTVDGVFLCNTLEDRVREPAGWRKDLDASQLAAAVAKWKIPAETAIPAGRYEVVITRSARFGTDLPLLVGVPGFAGIRIHAGNRIEDTEGCILVGRRSAGDTVLESRFALLEVMVKIRDGLGQGEVWIDVRNA